MVQGGDFLKGDGESVCCVLCSVGSVDEGLGGAKRGGGTCTRRVYGLVLADGLICIKGEEEGGEGGGLVDCFAVAAVSSPLSASALSCCYTVL